MNGPAPAAMLGRPQGRFELAFHNVGGRSRIGRQYVSYPFHLTRPFALDSEIPALITLYQQSSAGGLYRADRLENRLDLTERAAVHLTSQAATVVHDCRGERAEQTLDASLDAGAFLAWTPDPLVLFPGAALASRTRLQLDRRSVALFSDAFALHDPSGCGRTFDTYSSDFIAIDMANGSTMLRDRFEIRGADLERRGSPMGSWRLAASHFLLGPAERLPSRDKIAAAIDTPGLVAGVSQLPNGSGFGIRVLAMSAVDERRLAERLFRSPSPPRSGPCRRPGASE